MTDRRLVEAAFPLRQVSLDSVHEKNVRHGHVSTLHIWPARRPLAASRATLLATLLRDPGTEEGHRTLLGRMAGSVEPVPGGDGRAKETRGGILHWGRESEPEGVDELDRFRAEIREAFGRRAPRVLDPFAGGGAIPLEAMRLGCEAVAADLNPVAWFLLRCTLHYPHRLARQERPLPAFAAGDREFVEAFLKARGIRTPAALREALARFGHGDGEPVQGTALPDAAYPDAAYADAGVPTGAGRHGGASPPSRRAGSTPWWVRTGAGRRGVASARLGTTGAGGGAAGAGGALSDLRGVRAGAAQGAAAAGGGRGRALAAPVAAVAGAGRGGRVSTAALNAEFDSLYLENENNPRWIAKPAVAYLWARTVRCGGCRAGIPLLKTRWLCRKATKRVLLALARRADGSGVDFDVERDVPEGDGTAAERRAHDRTLGAGTMSASGARCPACGAIATTKDIRAEGLAGRLGERMTAVVVEGQTGKEYRLPTAAELDAARVAQADLDAVYADIPFGPPDETIVAERPSPNSRGASGLPRYGFDTWRTLFTDRQLLALGTFVRAIRGCREEMRDYPDDWREAIVAWLAPSMSRLADRGSAVATWTNNLEQIRNTFARFALPMVWDFAESCPLADTTGGFIQAVEWIARVVEHAEAATAGAPAPRVELQSATAARTDRFDLVCTDPPYYDAIPYSDLMDFFHVWLRRTLHGLSPEVDAAFAAPLGPKWDAGDGDGELVDQPGRFGTDGAKSRRAYEDGMLRTFRRCHEALRDDGRMVVVFANKQPAAWATLVTALIRAGFVVDASWPIQTERDSKVAGGARLSSSIWLVCRKRPADARPGWDNRVLADMQAEITTRLRAFWDAVIRGPDFVWAATGPALEAFSRHPVVKKADAPGELLTVDQFLRRVRRMVVGFVVSRLLDQQDGAAGELDDPTTYYLLHRKDFGLAPAPAGACILYALSCNVSDADLAGRLDLLAGRGRSASPDDDEDDGDEGEGRRASDVRLKTWSRRRARDLGEPAPDGRPPPLIDCLHKLMQLWKSGEQSRVDAYLEGRGLWRHEVFARVVQAVTELAERGTEERTMLESIQTHVRTHGGAAVPRPLRLDYDGAL